jgi:hypothetical protein
MTKQYLLAGYKVSEKRAYQLYHLLKLREAYNTVMIEHGQDHTVRNTVLPLYNSNDKRLRQLGRRIWGSDWGTHSTKHRSMSWRNIHSTQLEALGIEY